MHISFPVTFPRRSLFLKRSQRQEGTGPARGTQSVPGPSLPAGSRPGNALRMFLPSLAATVQMPEDPVDSGPGECKASLGCFTCRQTANKCSVQAVGILGWFPQHLRALTSVCANLNKAVRLRRQVWELYCYTPEAKAAQWPFMWGRNGR